MKIKVTQDDIDCGVRKVKSACPVALATKLHFSNADVIVDYDTLFIGYEWFTLPEEAKDFINNFDNGDEVEPFEFEVNHD